MKTIWEPQLVRYQLTRITSLFLEPAVINVDVFIPHSCIAFRHYEVGHSTEQTITIKSSICIQNSFVDCYEQKPKSDLSDITSLSTDAAMAMFFDHNLFIYFDSIIQIIYSVFHDFRA